MREWSRTTAGRIVILLAILAVIALAFAVGAKVAQPYHGKYADTIIYEVGGTLKTAKLFCYQSDCKWLITFTVSDVVVLKEGLGILNEPVVGADYTVDIRDSKMNNYVVTAYTAVTETPNVKTYDYKILNKNIRVVLAETVDTSSGLPEVVGAVR